MKTFILLITALTFAIPHASSQPPEAAAQTPAWVQKFNTLPEETRKQYIGKFQEAERFFAQKEPWKASSPSWNWKKSLTVTPDCTTSAAPATLKSATLKSVGKL